MTSEREELANLIASVTIDTQSGDVLRVHPDGETPVFEGDQRTADDIIAAGYRRSRIIRTLEELDKMPLQSVVALISHVSGDPITMVFHREFGGNGWCTPATKGYASSKAIFEFIQLNGFPPELVVLYEGCS